ncbi:GIY-YIG nuclease family protein [Mycoplasma phocoeninasale]|uniref:GIY-YIG nuclease family protein n=1 Tax=Mycoplasma phocoeninasale TaxID=2726117 RepID=A0A858U1A8_9MOLU|nr:GIY-YIG nuclease family protein [Mycoplasma phocoeninasale]QJG66230.1 GIY-YIG nuclease family protein [Mycoplasma phocoeninasale]
MISKELIKDVSDKPGVYLWKDKFGKVIYVGKAKNLKQRMSQYFDSKMLNSYKTPKMLEKIASFSTIILESDREAFIQERKLIDEYRPFYNVLFPVRNSFPYIRVKLHNNNVLEIAIKNKYEKEKNALYYGPLPNNKDFKPLIRYLNHLLLSQDGLIVEKQSKEFATERFQEAKKVMNFGKHFKSTLNQKIADAIENNMFEQAKFYNDILELLNYNAQDQHIFIKSQKAMDVFGFFQKEDIVLIHAMVYRNGTLINQQDFSFQIKTSLVNAINEFLSNFYANQLIPDQIIFPEKYKDLRLEFFDLISFSETELSNKAQQNAENNVELKIQNYNNLILRTAIAQENLSAFFKCPTNKIAILDNSFLKGSNEVIGGGILYINGQPSKKDYRFYNLDNSNLRHADVEYMRQTSLHYFKEFANEIDVILADGAMAQIAEIKASLSVLNLNIPVFGLVKDERHETKYVVDEWGNLIDITDSNSFNLLARMQTEVDRFVKAMYNKKHLKALVNNPLLKINGLGKATLEKLLLRFKTYQNILSASLEELKEIISEKLARKIIEEKW